jgi:FkbM family methyltransferase
MVGSRDFEEANRATIEQAASSKGGMTIDQLQSQPPYCGFVEGVVFEDLKFVMLLVDADDGIALRWTWNHAYEAMSLALWSLLARKSDVILDVGAHTGVYSMAASIANDKATVISVEPSWLNLSRLAANLRSNGLSLENIVPAAISDTEGVTDFTLQTQFVYHSAGGKFAPASDERSLQVQTLRIDSLYHQHKLATNLIKIDVEGHEANVLRSMPDVLTECAPEIFIETTDTYAAKECTAILKDHGYRFFCIDDEAMSLCPVEAIEPSFRNGHLDMAKLNRLASRKSLEEIDSLVERSRALWQGADHLRQKL